MKHKYKLVSITWPRAKKFTLVYCTDGDVLAIECRSAPYAPVWYQFTPVEVDYLPLNCVRQQKANNVQRMFCVCPLHLVRAQRAGVRAVAKGLPKHSDYRWHGTK